MKIETIVNSWYNSTSNLIFPEDSNECWVVDIGDTENITRKINIRASKLSGILLTHGHFDHIYGINELISIYPEAIILTNGTGKEMLLDSRKNMSYYHNTPLSLIKPKGIRLVCDGEEVEMGGGVKARAVFTPGHNPSCITWVVGDAVFTGDSLIPGLKTVTNLPGGDKALAAESEKIIMELAKGRTIYPGHKI